MRRLHLQRLLLCCALLLLPTSSALWFSMPPECDGRCWEEDVKHPLSSCDLEVVAGAITPAEADEVVAAAEAHAATHGWHSQRHIAYPTMDLPWTALPAVARIFDKLWGAMEASVRARCGIRPLDRLTPNDVFVVKYTPEGQAGLDRHRDASGFSFNAALSDPESYGGGGTRVWLDSRVDATVRPDRLLPEDGEVHKIAKGSTLVQGGRNVHEGLATTSGVRYIVAGFVGINRHCCGLRYAGWRGVMALIRVKAKNDAAKVNAGSAGDLPLWDYVLYREWLGFFAWIKVGVLKLGLVCGLVYVTWRSLTRASPRFNLLMQRAFGGAVGGGSSFAGDCVRRLARRRRRAMDSVLPTKHSLDD